MSRTASILVLLLTFTLGAASVTYFTTRRPVLGAVCLVSAFLLGATTTSTPPRS